MTDANINTIDPEQRVAALTSLAQRLDRVERENRWFRRLTYSALMFGAVLIASSALHAQNAPAAAAPPIRLEAGQFALIDSAGKVCGTFRVEGDAAPGQTPTTAPSGEAVANFTLGSTESATVALSAGTTASGLVMSDRGKINRADFSIQPDRTARFQLNDGEGNPRLLLRSAPTGGSAIALVSDAGVRTVLGTNKKKTFLQFAESSGTARMEMGLNSGEVSWITLLDSQGKRRIALSVGTDGPAKIEILDADEKPVWSAP